MSELSDLLAKLDPAVIIDGPEQRASQALSTFPMGSTFLIESEEFKDLMARFHQHVQSNVRGVWPYYDYEWNYAEATDLLKSMFGPDGVRNALIIAGTGIKGGMYAIMKEMARAIVKEHIHKTLRVIVGTFLFELGDEEREAAVQEYLTRYRDMLLPELVENEGLGLFIEFEQVLLNHPFMLQNFSLSR